MTKVHHRINTGKLKRQGYIEHMEYNALPDQDKTWDIPALLKKRGPFYTFGWKQCSDTHKMPKKKDSK